jgi:transcriptional regulator GlxA family with amidase domain
MAKTVAERMVEYRKRQAEGRRELVSLRQENERLLAAFASLEAELEQARDATPAARCGDCGTALACPRCHSGGDWA